MQTEPQRRRAMQQAQRAYDNAMPDEPDETPQQVKLEPGHTYKVKANISGAEKWHTVVRRPIDGKPGIYYVEEDFHDYYYEDDDWNSDDVRVLE